MLILILYVFDLLALSSLDHKFDSCITASGFTTFDLILNSAPSSAIHLDNWISAAFAEQYDETFLEGIMPF